MSNFITYKASAGSGKTYTLAVEYIKQLLLSGDAHAHRHILAVTFTKDATGEMKDRIIAELYGLAGGLADSKGFLKSIQEGLKEMGEPMTAAQIQTKAKRVLTDILHDYSRFYVGTIDSFFQRVLRNLARELGKGSKFNIELNTTRVVSEAVKQMIEKSNENPKLLEWIGRYIEEKIENGQSWRVDKELKSFGMNIFNEYFQEHEMDLRKQIDANPKLIDEMYATHRKKRKEFEDAMKAFARKFFLILEESGVSKNELSGSGDGGAVGSYFNKMLNGQFDDTGNSKMLTSGVLKCLEDPTKWVKGEVKKERKPEIIYIAKSVLIHMLREAEDFRTQHLMHYNSSVLILKNIHQLGLLWDIAMEMETQNKDNNRFMLSQTALFLNQMIQDSDASFVYEKIGSQIQHVMIDEFQDTSRLQWRNFKSLLTEILANNNFSLVVGDVKQSIYRWRNGDWSILNSIEQQLETTHKTLANNYRSQKRVVHFNNEFFVKAAEVLDVTLNEDFGAEVDSPFARAYDSESVEQKSIFENEQGYVSIHFISDDKEEELSYREASLQCMLEKLEELQTAGVEASQICVLTRTNREIMEVAEFLSQQKGEYPNLAEGQYLDIISNDAFQLAASPALKIIVEALRSLSDWENPVPRAQLLLMWQEALKTEVVDMHRLLMEPDNTDLLLPEGFRKADYSRLEVMPLYELILHIYRIFSLDTLPHQSSYLYAFLDNLMGYLQQNASDITTFLNYWDEELCNKSVPNESGLGGIRAMTIHKSKGLQFHTVIVAFCDWKMAESRNGLVWCTKKEAPYDLELLPVNHNLSMKQSVFSKEYMDEITQLYMDNLNVAYVAFTRAERNLIILSKQPSQKSKTLSIATVLSKLSQTALPGNFSEAFHSLSYGEIDGTQPTADKESGNLLKYNAKKHTVAVDFIAQEIPDKESIFRQSNKSKDFIATGEAPTESQYIQQGNLMHRLFSKINSQTDAPKAVEQLIFDGLITRNEQQTYLDKISEAIAASEVEAWFSGNYQLFNECLILTKDENGKTRLRQPDRVMIGNDEVIIVDYKFGEAKKEHALQVQEYKTLLEKMGYANVIGCLWYVSENRKVVVSG